MGKFKRSLGNFIVSLGELPASYRESLSYEEQLLWLCEHMAEMEEYLENVTSGLTFDNYSNMVSTLNTELKDTYNAGQSIKIQTKGVYDLWVSGVDSVNRTYSYTSDSAIISALNTTGYIQVGYYILKPYEAYIDLSSYATKTYVDTNVNNAKQEINTTLENNYFNSTYIENNYELLANKVTSVSSASTNNQYPTAKCLYDLVGDIESLLSEV